MSGKTFVGDGDAIRASIVQIAADHAAAHGRPPSFPEINRALGSPHKGYGSLTYHVKCLVREGYLENRWRHRGLFVLPKDADLLASLAAQQREEEEATDAP